MALPQSSADFFVWGPMTNCHLTNRSTVITFRTQKSIKDKEGFGSAHREHPASSRAELAFHLAHDFGDSLIRRVREPRPLLVVVWCR
jgi:hypothetical protein